MLEAIKKYWGEIFFLFYLLMACVFYKERTLFLDNAFQAFLLIQDGYIEINANRWPAVINRVLPWMAVLINCKLECVLLLFSVNYVLVQYLIFLLIKRPGKTVLALGYVLILALAQNHAFFWCNSELVLLLGFIFMWWSLFSSGRWIAAAFLTGVIAWTHPVSLVAFTFLIGLLWINNRFTTVPSYISAIVFYPNYWLQSSAFPNWYDTMKKESFAFQLENYQFLRDDWGLSLVWESGWLYVAIISLVIVWHIQKRFFKPLIFFLISSLLLLLMLDIGNLSPGGSSFEFYNEVNMMTLFYFCVASVLVHFNTPGKHLNPQIKIYILLLCIVSGMIQWIPTSRFYTDRINWFEKLVAKHDRAVIDENTMPQDILVQSWASACESLLISSIKGNSQTVLISGDPRAIDIPMLKDSFITAFRNYPLEEMNPRYFNLSRKSYYLD